MPFRKENKFVQPNTDGRVQPIHKMMRIFSNWMFWKFGKFDIMFRISSIVLFGVIENILSERKISTQNSLSALFKFSASALWLSAEIMQTIMIWRWYNINHEVWLLFQFLAPRIKTNYLQCYRSLFFAHNQSWYQEVPKCRKCGSSHVTEECSKTRNTDAQFAAFCTHPAIGIAVRSQISRYHKAFIPPQKESELCRCY